MSLTYHQTDLVSPIDKVRVDYAVFSGKWAMGRVHQLGDGAEPLRWSWSLYGVLGKPLGMRSDGRAATLEAAKAQFEASWRQWLEWAMLREFLRQRRDSGLVEHLGRRLPCLTPGRLGCRLV